jgi:hypothetical protein
MAGTLPSDPNLEMDAEGILDPEPRSDDDRRDPDGLAGQLVATGSEDVDVLDEEKDLVATIIGDDDDEGTRSAEEAAMHITDSP